MKKYIPLTIENVSGVTALKIGNVREIDLEEPFILKFEIDYDTGVLRIAEEVLERIRMEYENNNNNS